jgi:3-phenylpropionate/trans-cinnamate dioxygenase ferredoxin subunit
MAEKHQVCFADELQPGSRKVVEIGGRSIGVFNVNNQFYAIRNSCPHRGAPLCRGVVTGLVTSPELYELEMERLGEIVRCPWHGWEFDLTTGRSVFNPHKMRVKSYDVSVEPEPMDLQGDFVLVDGEPDPFIETFDTTVEPSGEQGRKVVFVHV